MVIGITADKLAGRCGHPFAIWVIEKAGLAGAKRRIAILIGALGVPAASTIIGQTLINICVGVAPRGVGATVIGRIPAAAIISEALIDVYTVVITVCFIARITSARAAIAITMCPAADNPDGVGTHTPSGLY